MKKKIVLLISIVAIGYFAYHQIMFGGARNLSKEEAAFQVVSKTISSEFGSDLQAANLKYLDKPIVILGTVTSINGTEIQLDSTVVCTFITEDTSINIGQNIAVKGRVVGYDDLFGELKLDQCSKQK